MARVQKLDSRIDSLDAEIKPRLIAALKSVVQGQMTTFFLSGRNTTTPEWLNCPETENLLDLADEAKSLREQLGESIRDTVGEQFRDYCVRAASIADANRLGRRRSTAIVLAELGEPKDQTE